MIGPSMIVATIAYLAAVSLAGSIAAVIAEGGLRRLGRPVRWVWLGALGFGPMLLAVGALRRALAWDAAPVLTPAFVPTLDVLALVPSAPATSSMSWAPFFERAFVLGWAGATAALAIVIVASYLRLAREKSTWVSRSVRGATVFVSTRMGPAVAGVLRPWIVLPEWVLGLPRGELRLVMRHEGEHLRAGDSRTVFAGLALAALVPWNPLSWWQLRRLRIAIELDCDARVLARSRDVDAYGAVLISVAAGVAPERPLAFAAFSENSSSLRVRILAMTARRPRWARALGVLLVVLAAALGVQACAIQGPTQPRAARGATLAAAREAPQVRLIGESAETALPAPSAEAEPIGRTSPTTRASAEATVEPAPAEAEVAGNESPTLPSASSPPDSQAVPRPPATSAPVSSLESIGAPSPVERSERPVFTPFSVAPKLTNRDEVGRALEAAYPMTARNEGRGGKAEIWVYIDEQGRVLNALIHTSSGDAQLDEGALRVGRTMKFTPALNRDRVVAVWVSIPITFQVR